MAVSFVFLLSFLVVSAYTYQFESQTYPQQPYFNQNEEYQRQYYNQDQYQYYPTRQQDQFVNQGVYSNKKDFVNPQEYYTTTQNPTRYFTNQYQQYQNQFLNQRPTYKQNLVQNDYNQQQENTEKQNTEYYPFLVRVILQKFYPKGQYQQEILFKPKNAKSVSLYDLLNGSVQKENKNVYPKQQEENNFEDQYEGAATDNYPYVSGVGYVQGFFQGPNGQYYFRKQTPTGQISFIKDNENGLFSFQKENPVGQMSFQKDNLNNQFTFQKENANGQVSFQKDNQNEEFTFQKENPNGPDFTVKVQKPVNQVTEEVNKKQNEQYNEYQQY